MSEIPTSYRFNTENIPRCKKCGEKGLVSLENHLCPSCEGKRIKLEQMKMTKEDKEQFLVLQNLFHDCDIKCRKLEAENKKLKDKWLNILGKKLREYQTEYWWVIMQRLLKETYEAINNV